MSTQNRDLLQECLAELEAGKTLSEVLDSHPKAREEVEPLLRIALRASHDRTANPDPDVIHRSRSNMLARAAKFRDAEQANNFFTWLPRYAVGIASALLVLVISGYGLFTASAQALPGDLLYLVKRSAEDIRLVFTSEGESRQFLEEEFQERRVDEVTTLLDARRVELVSFNGSVEQMADGNWIVTGISVNFDDDTHIIGDIELSDEIEVEGETQTEGFVFAFELHKRLITIIGTVERLLPAQWIIDGRTAQVTADSDIEDDITVGDAVVALLAVADDESLTILEVRFLDEPEEQDTPTPDPDEEAPEEIEFSGTVEAISPSTWIVDGRSLHIDSETDIDENITVGDSVAVQAKLYGGVLWALDIDLFGEGPEDSEDSEGELDESDGDDEIDEEEEGVDEETEEETEDESEDDEHSSDEEDTEEDEKKEDDK